MAVVVRGNNVTKNGRLTRRFRRSIGTARRAEESVMREWVQGPNDAGYGTRYHARQRSRFTGHFRYASSHAKKTGFPLERDHPRNFKAHNSNAWSECTTRRAGRRVRHINTTPHATQRPTTSTDSVSSAAHFSNHSACIHLHIRLQHHLTQRQPRREKCKLTTHVFKPSRID